LLKGKEKIIYRNDCCKIENEILQYDKSMFDCLNIITSLPNAEEQLNLINKNIFFAKKINEKAINYLIDNNSSFNLSSKLKEKSKNFAINLTKLPINALNNNTKKPSSKDMKLQNISRENIKEENNINKLNLQLETPKKLDLGHHPTSIIDLKENKNLTNSKHFNYKIITIHCFELICKKQGSKEGSYENKKQSFNSSGSSDVKQPPINKPFLPKNNEKDNKKVIKITNPAMNKIVKPKDLFTKANHFLKFTKFTSNNQKKQAN